MVRMSAMVRFCRPRLMAFSRFGMAMAAMMPMIATTISSSINVNPRSLLIQASFRHPFLRKLRASLVSKMFGIM